MFETLILLCLFIVLLFVLSIVIRRDIQLFNDYWEKRKQKNEKDNTDKL